MSGVPVRGTRGYVPAYARFGKRCSVKIPRGDADVAVARGSARVSSRQVALSTGYTPFPGFVPTHIPNY
jgi:hypothetical protein